MGEGLDPINLAKWVLGLLVIVVIVLGAFKAVGHFTNDRMSKLVGTFGVMVVLAALFYSALELVPTLGRGVADKGTTVEVTDLPTFKE